MLWNRLPDTMATHFDSQGAANGWSSKAFVVFGMSFFILGCHLLCAFATAADPRRQNISDKMYRVILWICPVTAVIVAVTVYGTALGFQMNMALWARMLIGVLFVIVGNYLPKCRQNFTVGIKLPWTLDDEDNWNRTHRLAGMLWVAAGLLVMISSLLPYAGIILFASLMTAAIVPCVYSFCLYVKKGNR